MQQSPSREANSHSASQEIPRLLCTLEVHYRLQKSPPLISILNQMHPIPGSCTIRSIMIF